jgi:hypothetical protein
LLLWSEPIDLKKKLIEHGRKCGTKGFQDLSTATLLKKHVQVNKGVFEF